MAFECRRAREYYDRAENALTAAERPMLLPAEIMRAIYHHILEQIEASHYQVFGPRISLPPWRRLAIAVKVWLALNTKRD
jgi:phytoene synthase